MKFCEEGNDCFSPEPNKCDEFSGLAITFHKLFQNTLDLHALFTQSIMKEEILRALESIRPFLQADNGDVELVEITEEKIVKVKLTGDCQDCPMSPITLRAGIERALMNTVPGIKRIEAVN